MKRKQQYVLHRSGHQDYRTPPELFGALDAGRFGIVIYGQQGNAFAGTLAQPAASAPISSATAV